MNQSNQNECKRRTRRNKFEINEFKGKETNRQMQNRREVQMKLKELESELFWLTSKKLGQIMN